MKFVKKGLFLFIFLTMNVLCLSKEQLKVYTVVKGDTLYSIAQNFYNDASQWKKIHLYNDFIKDPHWIFPGDELVMPKEVPEEKNEEPSPIDVVAVSTPTIMSEQVKQAVEPEAVSVSTESWNADAFVADKNWKYDGHIVAEEEKKIVISQGDTVFIGLEKGVEVKLPARMTIYHKDRVIIDPYTGDELGYLVKKVGVLEVKNNLQGKTLTGEIIMASDSVSAGDFIKLQKQ